MNHLHYRITILFLIPALALILSCRETPLYEDFILLKQTITPLIDSGEFTRAETEIRYILEQNTLAPEDSAALAFEIERMQRIRKDFSVSYAEAFAFIQQTYPSVTETDMINWEERRALEFKIIDGQKWYFDQAARNLFRIDPQMKAVWDEQHPDTASAGSGSGLNLNEHNSRIIQAAIESGKHFVEPRRLQITHSITVDANIVPAGETIRCWIPYPREISGRQENISLLASLPTEFILAPAEAMQRTIYFEKIAQKDQAAVFSVSYELTAHGVYYDIDSTTVKPLPPNHTLQAFLDERPPQIVFSDDLKNISRRIVGDETNPYLIARRLFEYVNTNYPWASAREYSTIRCIPQYAYENGHGDCGIQTLLFMTLCRLNGIPTRWQSGWELQPPKDSMHDWGMIYFEPYGWVPMDVTYGLRDSEDPRLHWFYLGGMDSYRIIFNDDYSQTFYPEKYFPRSETIDSQRGEVEWSGGNLYFDQWHWDFKWEILDKSKKRKTIE